MLTALAEVFGEDVGEVRLAAYVEALSDLERDALRAACQRAVREATFFPRPAELRQWALWEWGWAWRERCSHEPTCGTPNRCALNSAREERG
jgi:hypothetical protein